MTTVRDWDAIVVGLGGIGSGAAYWLSRRLGDRVLGLEQFELGHSLGAGQDHSRIIRLSYHRPDYVRLARRAYATWAEVEAESGTQVVFRTGGLDVGPREKDQGVGSEILVRPQPDGTIVIGGRVELVETRDYALAA